MNSPDRTSTTNCPDSRTLRTTYASAGLLLLSACGSSGDSGGDAETTVDDWRDYCVATFTEDYTFVDVFGDPAFTAHSGEEYAVASLDEGLPPELVYLAAAGPEIFSIDASGGALPFTTNCTAGSTVDHLAVFSDTAVFAEETLATPICDLAAGSAHPRDTTSASGYAATNSRVGSAVTYEIMLNSFGPDCGGAERGNGSVPETTVFGSTTWLVPIITIVGPA
jgi:hypothetical protein